MTKLQSHPNPLLLVEGDNKPNWNRPDNRRHGFHNLYHIARYALSFRARTVLKLEKQMDLAIADLPEVRRLTQLPWFSAMVIAKGQKILHEAYAPDFGPNQAHSIQSITKTTMNLAIGQLWEAGKIDLAKKIGDYLPEMGSGYAGASVQQVLNMDVINDYSEDYHDPQATVFFHEEAMGSRLPADPAKEMTMRGFLPTISSSDTTNRSGKAVYKSANTDVLAQLVERVSGRPLRAWLADITDAAGLEGAFNITCDREGTPTIDGGACVTARDLARYALLFARKGQGVNGEKIGSAAFMERTLASGIPMPAPRDWLKYSNQTNTDGRWLGHGGYGGQYMLADMTSGVVGVFFSVLEDQDAYDSNYYVPIIRTLEAIARKG